jgi:hypothetical protein
MRRAGFARVAARNVDIVHRFEVDSYLGQLEADDAAVTFEKLDPERREQLRRRLRERLGTLPESSFEWPRRLVSVLATA